MSMTVGYKRSLRVTGKSREVGTAIFVSQPDGWTWNIPFDILLDGGVYSPYNFDLQAHAAITVNKTYYVSPTGSDLNDGLSWETALGALSTALAKSDVDRVYVAAGYYYRNISWSGYTCPRNVEVIGVGTVYLTSDCYNQISGWTLVGNHYEGTTARTVQDVWDISVPDEYGEAVQLTQRASSAEVDANPGSWYLSGGVLYVRTLDSRAPDSDLRYYEGGSPCNQVGDSLKLYVENIIFEGGLQVANIENSSVTGGIKFYAKDCTFRYAKTLDTIDVDGANEVILQNVNASKSAAGDGINYHAKNGIAVNAIEIDVNSYDNGNAADSIDQGSSIHDAGNIVRIGGSYKDNRGACIADVGGTKSWNLGVTAEDSSAASAGARANFWCGNGGASKMWLDGCISDVTGTYDLVVEGSCTMYIRDVTENIGARNILGTLESY